MYRHAFSLHPITITPSNPRSNDLIIKFVSTRPVHGTRTIKIFGLYEIFLRPASSAAAYPQEPQQNAIIFGLFLYFESTSIVLRNFSEVSIFKSIAFVGHTLTHVPHPLHLNLSMLILSDSIVIALYGQILEHKPHKPHFSSFISIPLNSAIK